MQFNITIRKWLPACVIALAIIGSLVFSSYARAVWPDGLKVGDIIRCGNSSAIFYLATDGQRHQFQNIAASTWGVSSRSVKRVASGVCRRISAGSAVTPAPGSLLIQLRGDKKIYAIAVPNVLRHVAGPSVARALYGGNWNRGGAQGPLRVVTLAVFNQFRRDGAPIISASDFDKTAELAKCSTINECLGLGQLPSPVVEIPASGTDTGSGSNTGGGSAPENAGSATGGNSGSGASVVPNSTDPVTIGISDPTRVLPVGGLTWSAVGVRVTDSIFGTTVRRITDRVATGGFSTHIYSQLQAFSGDSQYVLLTGDDGYTVRRLSNLSLATVDLENVNAPRWQPARPNTLVYFDTNEDAVLRVQYATVGQSNRETVYTFPANYQRIRGNQSFDELSHDGRWIAGMASTANNDQMMFALNLETRTLGAQISLNNIYNGACARDPHYGAVEPDWIGVSPLGKYLVVQWKRDGTARCRGLETFDIQTGAFVGRVYDSHQHGDLGLNKDGVTEFFMTFEMTSAGDNGRPSQGLRVLPGPATGVAQPRYLQTMDWGNQSHLSCQGPNGVCLVTAGSDASNGRNPFEGELFLQYTDGRILRLAHHRSTECGYWVQSRASMSRDGRYVIFASDWGVNRCAASNEDLGRGEAYIIELPANIANGPATTAPAS
ncbi:MAG: hypothetical protein HY851_07380 [candidate division Zixibacteria bacterium]|nr:hypothetical protein [candidate division Zixibacteria bacterium]